MKNLIYLVPLLLSSCFNTVEPQLEEYMGLAPIYSTNITDGIKSENFRDFEQLGKIVYKKPFIYINERYQGIHVIDNNNPANPETIAFWNIPGVIDFTVKENFLYAENGEDLITIDVSDIFEIKVLSVIENINTVSNHLFPSGYSGWFECVNEDLGIVIGWEEKLLTNPQCWR